MFTHTRTYTHTQYSKFIRFPKETDLKINKNMCQINDKRQ